MIDPNSQLDQWGPIDGKLLYQSFWFWPIATGAGKKWGAPWPGILGILDNYKITYFFDKKDMTQAGTYAIEVVILNNEKRRRLWRAYLDIQKELKKIAKVAGKKGNSYEIICPLAIKWRTLLDKTWEIGVTPELANFGAPEYLENLLKSFVSSVNLHSTLEILLAPEELSFHQQSQKELLELAVKYNKKIPEKEMTAYTKRWFWVENSYFESKVLKEKDFLKGITGENVKKLSLELRRIKSYKKSVKENKKEIIKKYKLPKDIQKMSKLLAHSIWWQDNRKGIAWWCDGITDTFSLSASKKLNVPFEDIMMYMADEWKNLFESKKTVSPEIIAERKKLMVIEISPKGVFYYTGDKAEEIKSKFSSTSEDLEREKNSEIKGIVVSQGKATGRVRVLFSSKGAESMKDGEVLVVPMTSPDFIVAMRKASAVITDIGGLMSHAAIISRELGIPCIVGTKIATKVLKDGMMVEVDAKNGIVKILARS